MDPILCPPQLLKTGCLERLILLSWSSLNTIKPTMSLFPQRMRQLLILTQIVWTSLSLVLILLVTSLQALEAQSRDMIRILSHSEICSFASFKCLQSESMDSRVLMKILQSMSTAIMDAMSITSVQTLGLQPMRCEAAIESAPKGSLTSETKRKLRLAPFTFKLLFAVYKDNVAENQETLVKKAIINQAKPNPPSSSSRRPKAKNGAEED